MDRDDYHIQSNVLDWRINSFDKEENIHTNLNNIHNTTFDGRV